ncbi:unnamed protein product [Prorocentrum cordatum]|uniref:Uncharacterized protein n=1 Tax=Prorocentrum cordatum TaxID=2364126 RepID=A0ABN9UC66_9DINO|nr:unnamed protein product [Polarella glacialis]
MAVCVAVCCVGAFTWRQAGSCRRESCKGKRRIVDHDAVPAVKSDPRAAQMSPLGGVVPLDEDGDRSPSQLAPGEAEGDEPVACRTSCVMASPGMRHVPAQPGGAWQFRLGGLATIEGVWEMPCVSGERRQTEENSVSLLEVTYEDLATLTGVCEVHWVSTERRPLAEVDRSFNVAVGLGGGSRLVPADGEQPAPGTAVTMPTAPAAAPATATPGTVATMTPSVVSATSVQGAAPSQVPFPTAGLQTQMLPQHVPQQAVQTQMLQAQAQQQGQDAQLQAMQELMQQMQMQQGQMPSQQQQMQMLAMQEQMLQLQQQGHVQSHQQQMQMRAMQEHMQQHKQPCSSRRPCSSKQPWNSRRSSNSSTCIIISRRSRHPCSIRRSRSSTQACSSRCSSSSSSSSSCSCRCNSSRCRYLRSWHRSSSRVRGLRLFLPCLWRVPRLCLLCRSRRRMHRLRRPGRLPSQP